MAFMLGDAAPEFSLPWWCAMRPETCLNENIWPQMRVAVQRTVRDQMAEEGAALVGKFSAGEAEMRKLFDAESEKLKSQFAVGGKQAFGMMLASGVVVLAASWWVGRGGRWW
jgi:hypothetical protein